MDRFPPCCIAAQLQQSRLRRRRRRGFLESGRQAEGYDGEAEDPAIHRWLCGRLCQLCFQLGAGGLVKIKSNVESENIRILNPLVEKSGIQFSFMLQIQCNVASNIESTNIRILNPLVEKSGHQLSLMLKIQCNAAIRFPVILQILI